MIVKYLELENYRRFKKVQLELPQGIIGIIGLNGSGKSTLVEAIAWALYGNEPPITRTKKGEVKRAGAGPKDPCRVVLEFSLSGDNYHLVREIRGASQAISAELEINNRTEATGAKAVTELLHSRLGMDYKSFFASVFARQKELNALSSETPNVRKKLVLRMLNIEFLEKVKADIGKDKRYAAKFIEGLKAGKICGGFPVKTPQVFEHGGLDIPVFSPFQSKDECFESFPARSSGLLTRSRAWWKTSS